MKTNIKIEFKKKRLLANLILGLVWSLLGIFNLMQSKNLYWLDYGYLVIGVLYIGNYLYDLKFQYLIIDESMIKMNALYGFRKKIYIKDIQSIKKFAGDYKIITADKEININTQLIAKDSLIKLNTFLEKLKMNSVK